MTPASATKPAAKTPRALSGLRAFVIGLFLAIQSFLVLHQLEHSLRLDLAGPPDDCALCQASANLLPAPEPTVVTVPVIPFVDRPQFLPAPQTAAAGQVVTGFRSRAPPRFLSA